MHILLDKEKSFDNGKMLERKLFESILESMLKFVLIGFSWIERTRLGKSFLRVM